MKLLSDTDKILQKINRHLDPPIGILRSKKFIKDQKNMVALLIPISIGVTHVISKDGSFTYPSGEGRVVLRKGTIYVRRSAGNHLADARDVDDIINRRLEHFKESLLDKITRVVEAPPQSEVIVMSHGPNAEVDQKFIIDDGQEAIPVKGMSFSTPPETAEQEIASWGALFSKYKNTIPPDQVIWDWYRNRHSIQLSEKHRVTVAEFCILSEVPPFFWLQGCSAGFIKEMIKDAMENRSSILQIDRILKVAVFLGKRFYDSILKSLDKSNLSRKEYPSEGPRSIYESRSIELMRNRNKYSEEQLKAALESELTKIADKLYNKKIAKSENYNMLVWQASCFDCYLYAQDNRYG